ncbi:hypothetical protein Pfo_029416 [Paulownia fortunei]|nr:hypothetical protein Pfo_029416 [Paulownia fortunei]
MDLVSPFSNLLAYYWHRSLSSCSILEINSTTVVLIPKIQNPSKLGDYRPISCCNSIYKYISKIISQRIKEVIPDLASLAQTAFIQGRRIYDNILLAQELLQNYHLNNLGQRCAIKVDLHKAYDSVQWDFLLAVLRCMNFPLQMVKWIETYITSPRFSISINGELNGYLQIFNGIMESTILEEDFQFHWRCKNEKIHYLTFADDRMIFSNATLQSVITVKNVLEHIFQIVGRGHNKQSINSAYPWFKEGNLPVRYLGVPLITSRLRANDCKALVDKITARVRSWTNKSLSYAGRVQLAQSVLFSIQIFWSAVFILPKTVCKAIDRVLRSFIWKGTSMDSFGAKVAWDTVCCPKNEGSLGLKLTREWNKAAMVKHIWHILSKDSDSIWTR